MRTQEKETMGEVDVVVSRQDVAVSRQDVVVVNRQLRFRELKSIKGIPQTRMTIWRWEQEGKFPKRHHTPTGRVFWWESEIDAWLAALEIGGGNPLPEKRVA